MIPPQIADQELTKFWDYWTEPNKSGTKQRWEIQPVFDLPRRLKTWFSRMVETQQKQQNFKARGVIKID